MHHINHLMQFKFLLLAITEKIKAIKLLIAYAINKLASTFLITLKNVNINLIQMGQRSSGNEDGDNIILGYII